ncbi:MAG: SMI1/KNR4 family protein [Planctomycetes bacterium]|nr:SMI1/KNR4 family protein [Planctomycetota bacterium]
MSDRMSELQGSLVDALTSGDDPLFAALRRQGRHVRRDGRRLGILTLLTGRGRARPGRRRVRFDVAWGLGAEDYLLGDRRAFVLRDALAELADGRLVCAELHLADGRLRELRLLGTLEGPGAPLAPPDRWGDEPVRRIVYADPWNPEGPTPDRLGDSRRIATPYPVATAATMPEATDLQRWLLDAAGRSLPGDAFTGELRLRLAQPATAEEIERYETSGGIVLPADLKEAWRLTNGCAFFGMTFYGAYEAPLHRDRKRNRYEIVLIEQTQIPGVFITLAVRDPADGTGATYSLLDLNAQKVRRRWHRLRDCLADLEAQQQAVLETDEAASA